MLSDGPLFHRGFGRPTLGVSFGLLRYQVSSPSKLTGVVKNGLVKGWSSTYSHCPDNLQDDEGRKTGIKIGEEINK